MKLLLSSLFLFFSIALNAQSENIEGVWTARIVTDQPTFDIVMRIAINDTGRLACTLDIPAQNMTDFSTGTVDIVDGFVIMDFDLIHSKFIGKLVSETHMNGEWMQGEKPFEMNVQLSPDGIYRRQQEPVGELPYQEIIVTFPSQESPITLEGTLTIPISDNPIPVAILVSGSGAQDRNVSIMGHRPFLVIADRLTRAGIAVLRYDDRGTGNSTGDFNDASTLDITKDIQGAIDFIKTQTHFKPSKIGLIGHTEGGSQSIVVATETSDVAFLVLMAAPGTSNADVLINQTVNTLKVQNATEEQITADTTYINGVQGLMKMHAIDDPDTVGLKALTMEYFEQSDLIRSRFGSHDVFYASQLTMIQQKWYHSFVNFDSRDYLPQVHCPVLAISGTLDFQIDAEKNLNGISSTLKKAGHTDYQTEKLDSLNHFFQPAKTGMTDEYSYIDITFDEATLQLMSAWINQKTK